jgi:hypothetical protein
VLNNFSWLLYTATGKNNKDYKYLKIRCSGKYLDLRGIKRVSTLGYYLGITRNFVIFNLPSVIRMSIVG